MESLSRTLKIDPGLTGDLELKYQLTTKLYTTPEAYIDGSFVRALDERGYIDRLYK